METERMGRCARLAWDHAVERASSGPLDRPGVTTGHLLLGVLEETECAGGLILAKMQLDLKLAHSVTEFVLLHGRHRGAPEEPATDWGGVPHTRSARTVLEFALGEANLFSSTYPIGTEHLLLGLLRVPEGTGCRILRYLEVDLREVRATRDAMWVLLEGIE